MNENDNIHIQTWLEIVARGRIANKPILIQVIACRRTGDKPLPEPMMTQFTDAYVWH